jgi:hypothetical protein
MTLPLPLDRGGYDIHPAGIHGNILISRCFIADDIRSGRSFP